MYGYRGPIWGATPEPRAHGGVMYLDECRCGATRARNSNWTFEERGPWRLPHVAWEVES